MQKIVLTTSLFLFAVVMAAFQSGCTTGTAFSKPPIFPPSNLDYSSQLRNSQAQPGGSPYVPPGGFGHAPARSPMFSLGSGSRSGSC